MSKINCIRCEVRMIEKDTEPWQRKFICPRCQVTLNIIYQDLMSGCLVEKSYLWYNEKLEMLAKYDQDRDGNIINLERFRI